MRRQKTRDTLDAQTVRTAGLVIAADERSRERQIAQIRTRIDQHRRTHETEYPLDQVLRKRFDYSLSDELKETLDQDYRRAIIDELEWVLREVFEVTP